MRYLKDNLVVAVTFVAVLCACQSEQMKPEALDYTKVELTDSVSVVCYSQMNSTVNGQPFIPLGIYGVSTDDMSMVKDLGFNLVQSYQFFKMSEEEQKDYMDTAYENGMMVFAGLDATSDLTEDYVTKMHKTVIRFKNHPALYAWYLADEPSIKKTQVEDFQALYDWIKAEDSNHPVINSNWELGNFKNACDADMRQLYNGVAHRLTSGLDNYLSKENNGVRTWVAILNAYDSGWEGPGVTVPGINPTSSFKALTGRGLKDGDVEWEKEEERWKVLDEHKDNPTSVGFHTTPSFPDTPSKVRGAFYWAFAHGSNGVYYWLFSNPDKPLNLRWGWYTLFYQPALRRAVQSTLREVGELSSYLVNPLRDCTVYKDEKHPGMFVWSKCIDGVRLVIIINETASAADATIDLSPLGLTTENLEVFHEDGRVLSLVDGQLKDYFLEDEAHVYWVK